MPGFAAQVCINVSQFRSTDVPKLSSEYGRVDMVCDHEWLIFLFEFSDQYISILLTYLVGAH